MVKFSLPAQIVAVAALIGTFAHVCESKSCSEYDRDPNKWFDEVDLCALNSGWYAKSILATETDCQFYKDMVSDWITCDVYRCSFTEYGPHSCSEGIAYLEKETHFARPPEAIGDWVVPDRACVDELKKMCPEPKMDVKSRALRAGK